MSSCNNLLNICFTNSSRVASEMVLERVEETYMNLECSRNYL